MTTTASTKYISRDNALLLLGRDWRWCRDFARRNGIRLRQPNGRAGAGFLPADEMIAAIESTEPTAASAPGLETPEAVRARLARAGS